MALYPGSVAASAASHGKGIHRDIANIPGEDQDEEEEERELGAGGRGSSVGPGTDPSLGEPFAVANDLISRSFCSVCNEWFVDSEGRLVNAYVGTPCGHHAHLSCATRNKYAGASGDYRCGVCTMYSPVVLPYRTTPEKACDELMQNKSGDTVKLLNGFGTFPCKLSVGKRYRVFMIKRKNPFAFLKRRDEGKPVALPDLVGAGIRMDDLLERKIDLYDLYKMGGNHVNTNDLADLGFRSEHMLPVFRDRIPVVALTKLFKADWDWLSGQCQGSADMLVEMRLTPQELRTLGGSVRRMVQLGLNRDTLASLGYSLEELATYLDLQVNDLQELDIDGNFMSGMLRWKPRSVKMILKLDDRQMATLAPKRVNVPSAARPSANRHPAGRRAAPPRAKHHASGSHARTYAHPGSNPHPSSPLLEYAPSSQDPVKRSKNSAREDVRLQMQLLEGLEV